MADLSIEDRADMRAMAAIASRADADARTARAPKACPRQQRRATISIRGTSRHAPEYQGGHGADAPCLPILQSHPVAAATAPAQAAAPVSAACVRDAPEWRDRPAWWLPRYARRRTAATARRRRAPTPSPSAGTS